MSGQGIEWPHPLRLRVENQLGYKMVKWIERIEFIETEKTVGLDEGGRNEDDDIRSAPQYLMMLVNEHPDARPEHNGFEHVGVLLTHLRMEWLLQHFPPSLVWAVYVLASASRLRMAAPAGSVMISTHSG